LSKKLYEIFIIDARKEYEMLIQLLPAPPRSALSAIDKSKNQDLIANYPNLEAAIKEILDLKPQVIAFGEIHPDPGFTYKSTKARFTESILPLLAANGLRDLVIEQILTDPKIEAELKHFYDTGCEIDEKNTPTLLNNIKYSDKQDLIKMIKKCRALGIRVHAGGMTIAQADETIKHADFSNKITLRDKARKFTGKAMKTAINKLLRTNPKMRFAIYGGLIHNNIADNNPFLTDGTNFGRALSKRLGKGYFEIDLLPSQEKETIDTFGKIKNWEKLIPVNGVTCIKRNQTRIIFF
jgi:hypothetical protein